MISEADPAWVSHVRHVRGALQPNQPLAPFTWFRVGGAAELLFQPADEADLAAFLRALPKSVPLTIIGIGSNLLVRDGGIEGAVVRLGRGFGSIAAQGQQVTAGAIVPDAMVARAASNFLPACRARLAAVCE